MADSSAKHADNTPGKYYIDESCTMCLACIDEAPDNLKESDDGDHCVVFKQPANAEEEEAMQAAMEACPTESIGDDGE